MFCIMNDNYITLLKSQFTALHVTIRPFNYAIISLIHCQQLNPKDETRNMMICKLCYALRSFAHTHTHTHTYTHTHTQSITPLIQTLVIRKANCPERLALRVNLSRIYKN
jgi:hypothetical protein